MACKGSYDYEEDEVEWDEATRLGRKAGSGGERSLCDVCEVPLGRVANLEGTRSALSASCSLICSRGGSCSRCRRRILPGELHFQCTDCDSQVCTECGPGVHIDREYDFLDSTSGEQRVKSMNKKVLHQRKPRLRGTQSSDTALANEVICNAIDICKELGGETQEVHDKGWKFEGLCEALFKTKSGLDLAAVLQSLARAAQNIVAQDNSLQEVAPPCKVFGDIHGQFRDMLLFFNTYGMPSEKGPSFVFNGDFVDRGAHQLEVIGLITALKVAFPTKVFLNRGNHEDEVMSRKYNFGSSCTTKFGQEVGEQVLMTYCAFFNQLPLASLVGNRILVVHGGIGDGEWTLDDLRAVKRPLTHSDLQAREFVWNMLWSDPIEEDALGETFGVHESPRSKTARKFGWNITQAFCQANSLDLVVRSHQSKSHGYGFDVMHDEALMRVFTARDYEGHNNDGAILHITEAVAEGEDEPDDLLVVRAQVIRSLSKA